MEAEGIELMLLILKARRAARMGALKALDFAVTRCPAACERFVEIYGLKTIFALFMGKSKVRQRCPAHSTTFSRTSSNALLSHF